MTLSQWLDPLSDAITYIVLRHVSVLVPEQLLRVAQVAGVAGRLGPDVAKLKGNPGGLARFVEP